MNSNKNIKLELESIAPLLAKVPKPVDLPSKQVRFDAIQNNILQKIRAHAVANELQDVAPVLSRIDKNFLNSATPNFNDLQKQVFEKVATKKQGANTPSRLDALLDSLTAWISPQAQLAFSLLAVGFLLVGIQFSNVEAKSQLELSNAMHQCSEQEIQKYLAENIDDMDEHILIRKAELKTANEILQNADFQTKSIEDFWLQENDIDYIELETDLI